MVSVIQATEEIKMYLGAKLRQKTGEVSFNLSSSIQNTIISACNQYINFLVSYFTFLILTVIYQNVVYIKHNLFWRSATFKVL